MNKRWSFSGFFNLLPAIFLFSSHIFPPAPQEICPGCSHDTYDIPDYPLVLPDLRTLPPFDLRLVRDEERQRLILRFSNSIWNAGWGSLELRGDVDHTASQIEVTQYYRNAWGGEEHHRVGTLIFHPAHQHWHLDGFSRYEIWSLRSDGGLDALQATSEKVSYCLQDTDPYPVSTSSPTTTSRRYYSCEQQLQGISPGWIDTYQSDLPGQWLDISKLPDGYYVLVSHTDPFDLVREANENNNGALTYFLLEDQRIHEEDIYGSAVRAGKTSSRQPRKSPIYIRDERSAYVDRKPGHPLRWLRN